MDGGGHFRVSGMPGYLWGLEPAMDGDLRFVFLTDITEEELTTQLMPELEDNGIIRRRGNSAP